MTLGAINESVTVSADAMLLQTKDAKVATNVSNEMIDQLPLVVGGAMRSVFDLVNVVPEAKGSGTNVVLGGFSSNNFGLITSQANSPRQMQLGLKLYW